MSEDTVKVNKGDQIYRVELNRPEKKNALTMEMYERLTEVFVEAAEHDEIKMLSLTGSGGNFSSGNDLRDFAERSKRDLGPVTDFLKALRSFPKPLVAAVQGHAVGVGATMLLHCDIVVAAEDAMLSFPFVELGLVPEAGSSLLLPMRVGWLRASQILMFAEPVDAPTAWALGLLNQVFPGALLENALEEVEKKILSKPTQALKETKRLMRSGQDKMLSLVMEEEGQSFARCLQSEFTQKAIDAFLNKRPHS